jgi:hypothetical protein
VVRALSRRSDYSGSVGCGGSGTGFLRAIDLEPHHGPSAAIDAPLSSGAFAVGRDHLVATTHTLMLVYDGATLPLLLVLQSAGVRSADALPDQHAVHQR